MQVKSRVLEAGVDDSDLPHYRRGKSLRFAQTFFMVGKYMAVTTNVTHWWKPGSGGGKGEQAIYLYDFREPSAMALGYITMQSIIEHSGKKYDPTTSFQSGALGDNVWLVGQTADRSIFGVLLAIDSQTLETRYLEMHSIAEKKGKGSVQANSFPGTIIKGTYTGNLSAGKNEQLIIATSDEQSVYLVVRTGAQFILRIFKPTDSGWSPTAELTIPDKILPSASFGTSLQTADKSIWISDPGTESNSGRGAVHRFDSNDGQVAHFGSLYPTISPPGGFGQCFWVHGTTVFVGNPQDGNLAEQGGSVQVFSTDLDWMNEIVQAKSYARAQFGRRLCVSAEGVLYVYSSAVKEDPYGSITAFNVEPLGQQLGRCPFKRYDYSVIWHGKTLKYWYEEYGEHPDFVAQNMFFIPDRNRLAAYFGRFTARNPRIDREDIRSPGVLLLEGVAMPQPLLEAH